MDGLVNSILSLKKHSWVYNKTRWCPPSTYKYQVNWNDLSYADLVNLINSVSICKRFLAENLSTREWNTVQLQTKLRTKQDLHQGLLDSKQMQYPENQLRRSIQWCFWDNFHPVLHENWLCVLIRSASNEEIRNFIQELSPPSQDFWLAIELQ